MKKVVCTPLCIVSLWFAAILMTPAIAKAQGGEWKVWVKVSPCSGRFDWVTVAKQNPTGGGNFYYQADFLFPTASCTRQGCTFEVATSVAATLRTSTAFSNYCCRDYSVWQNASSGQKAVVLGKFGTAGLGWSILRADLCCEEAEALAGLTGACSGNIAVQQLIKNTQCYPGSFAAWNAAAQRVECYCYPGLIWNNNRTACITPPATDCSKYPGSYPAWNEQTRKMECWCPQGKVWNSTRTACVDNVTCPPGSYAAVNPQTGKTQCYCNPGLVWDAAKNACVDPKTLTDCSKYPGSYPAWNEQAKRMECWCPQGKVWNSTQTACVDNVTCPPGSYVAIDPQTNKPACYCNQGLVWNSNKTACITPPPAPPINNGGVRWNLVSVNMIPATPRPQWTHSAQSSVASFRSPEGSADFSWTALPQSFSWTGFTTTLNVTTDPAYGKTVAGQIVMDGGGLSTETPSGQQTAYTSGAATTRTSAQKTIYYLPNSTTTDVDVKITLNFGMVQYIYKYRKSQ